MAEEREILRRIEEGLLAARRVLETFRPGYLTAEFKEERGDPVTEADRRVDDLLRAMLPRHDEGWLSEETADDLDRLERRETWIVDPLDGTREFLDGIPEWCVSIGFVRDGHPVAGGICNSASDELILGAIGTGVTRNGVPAGVRDRTELDGAVVLASRSEVSRGAWARYAGARFTVRPMGSVAYKLAQVAAGRADATWSLAPKNEWDVAAGVALVLSGGGRIVTLDGAPVLFNRRQTLMSGFGACPSGIATAVHAQMVARDPHPGGMAP